MAKMKQRITEVQLHKPDQYIGSIHVHAKIDGEDYITLFTKKPSYKEVMFYLVNKMNRKE